MSTTIKPRILLPVNPDHYYGTSISVENLEIGMVVYVGPSHCTEPMKIESFDQDETKTRYEIHTDKAILTATPLTRIQYKAL